MDRRRPNGPLIAGLIAVGIVALVAVVYFVARPGGDDDHADPMPQDAIGQEVNPEDSFTTDNLNEALSVEEPAAALGDGTAEVLARYYTEAGMSSSTANCVAERQVALEESNGSDLEYAQIMFDCELSFSDIDALERGTEALTRDAAAQGYGD